MNGKLKNEKLPTLKGKKTMQKSQGKKNEIKRNLRMENQSWNDCKFQIHWSKLEWVNPRGRIEVKNPFSVSSN